MNQIYDFLELNLFFQIFILWFFFGMMTQKNGWSLVCVERKENGEIGYNIGDFIM